jgi:Fe-S-cluster containining protein
MGDLLPIVQRVANTIVDSAVDEVVEQGRTISCTKGCGACCRQLVPISEIEARGIRDLVRSMPEPRRSHVMARFAEAQRRLADAGLLDKLHSRADWDEDAFMEIGTRYFHQRIPCPFLEDESCSIHLDRPVVCREYLVTSPAANCACPTKDNIEKVPLPVQVWTALARCTQADPGAKYCRWVPLVLAPEWADSHPDKSQARPGPEVLREFFERLAAQGSQGDSSAAASPPSA